MTGDCGAKVDTDKFVFISYKSDDRDRIRPYIDMLESLGIPYWWDQHINEQWGKDIDEKLNSCAAVIGFLTEKSTNSSPVFEECRTGVSNNKFIPVKLDRSSMRYDFRSLIAFLNHIDLSSDSQEKNEAEKTRLIQKIAKYINRPLQADLQTSSRDNIGPLNLEGWISDPNRLPHIAYLISLCIFEGQSHDALQRYTALLEKYITEQGLEQLLHLNSTLTTKRSRLKLVGAESVKFQSDTSPQGVEFIRFENHLLNEDLLFHVWDELDQLKVPIILWMEELVENWPNCINDIASSLSKIGRKNFQSIYSIFLHRWLRSKSTNQFRCADLTLSLMAGDPVVRAYIREKLFDASDDTNLLVDKATHDATEDVGSPIGSSNQTVVQPKVGAFITNDIAVGLVTGFTGMAMPDLSIHIFKKIEANLLDPTFSVESRRNIELRMRKGIFFILIRSKTDLYAKAMLRVFAAGIKVWSQENLTKKNSLLPEFIFNILLSGLSIGRKNQPRTISLAELVNENERIDVGTTNAFSIIIASALESKNIHIRDMYKDLFKEWAENLARCKQGEHMTDELKEQIEADRRAFEILFKTAMEHASNENDKDRIRFLTKPICNL